jgi:predicted methyltransferase
MNPCAIPIQSQRSLIHIGSLDSFDITEGGKAAALCILNYLDKQDPEQLKRAEQIYDEIIPNENFGGEYTALRWTCRLLLAPERERAGFLSHPDVEGWHSLLSENSYAKLREYLNHKYHFAALPRDGGQAAKNLRFLEDFILFQNPDRERWEKTSEVLRRLAVPKGAAVADVGCGPGYYSMRFADLVGPTGKVYAIETNPMHLEYLRRFLKRHGVSNVEVAEGGLSGIGLADRVKADYVFMCSLYHVIYAALSESDRRGFLQSVRGCLADGGKLVIVDNDLVEDGDLPYHGPYISQSLVISQLAFYGFRLADEFRFTPQRYALVFIKDGAAPDSLNASTESPVQGAVIVKNGVSLIKYLMADAAPTAGFTPKGREAAELLLAALQTKKAEDAAAALGAYRAIIPLERIGDEYTAFAWLCECLLADGSQRAFMLADDLDRSYFEKLAKDDFWILRKYLAKKYEMPGFQEIDMENLTQISEYISFNNPNRDSWERTEEMLKYLNVGKGEHIADVGCGSGYFTYRFAKAVGAQGAVYSTEINRDALSYVEEMRERFSLPITPVVSRLNDACLPEGGVDTVFMCSMYHAVYIASIEFVKDAFIASVKKALRPGGRLVVVDNEIELPGVAPYYGSAIDRRLAIAQLERYGFALADERQFVPQRYVLVFKICDGRAK